MRGVKVNSSALQRIVLYIKYAVALREGPLPAFSRLRGPSLRVCCSVGMMSLLATATSLRSVTACLVAGFLSGPCRFEPRQDRKKSLLLEYFYEKQTFQWKLPIPKY